MFQWFSAKCGGGVQNQQLSSSTAKAGCPILARSVRKSGIHDCMHPREFPSDFEDLQAAAGSKKTYPSNAMQVPYCP